MILAAAALALAAQAADVDPYCQLSEAALAKQQEASQRRVSVGPLPRFARPDGPPIEGCGVWRVSISATGEVTSAELLRGAFIGDYEAPARDLIQSQRFQSSGEPWSFQMRVDVNAVD